MYEPAEDSFLLNDCVSEYLNEACVKSVLDMGTGTGYQAFEVAKNDSVNLVVAVDVSPESCRYVKEEIVNKGLSHKMNVICSDLFEDIPHRYSGQFDLIMFNAPYLPQSEDDEADTELYGGIDGIHLTKMFLKAAPKYLSENGVIFFVTSSHAKIKKLEEFMHEKGFSFEVVGKKHISFEDILVYKVTLS